MVDSHARNANLALSLERYIWVVSSLASDSIQVHCLEETQLDPIIPPLTLICIGNGCKCYRSNIYIPSKTDFTSEIDTSLRHDFFVSFNVIYQNTMQYGI